MNVCMCCISKPGKACIGEGERNTWADLHADKNDCRVARPKMFAALLKRGTEGESSKC